MKISDIQPQFKRYALFERGMQSKTFRSIITSLKMLTCFAQTEKLREFDQRIIREFLYQGRAEKDWKARTFRNHWTYLKVFFDWCLKNHFIRKNPVIGIDKPKLEKNLPRCISTEDAQKVLLHTARYPWRHFIERYRNEVIISTLLMTGLRLQELLNLQVSDIRFDSREIIVKQGKGRKDRIVPIHSSLYSTLHSYAQKKHKLFCQNQYFFSGIHSDKPLTPKDIRRICLKISIVSKVKFTPHMLRHTFARELIDKDFNLYKLKEIMGHADIKTTQRYLAISMHSIKSSFEQVEFY